jgi:hypothetical protein
MAFYRPDDDTAVETWAAEKNGFKVMISKWADGSHLLELSTGRHVYWDATDGTTYVWETPTAEPEEVHGIESFEQLAQRFLLVQ